MYCVANTPGHALKSVHALDLLLETREIVALYGPADEAFQAIGNRLRRFARCVETLPGELADAEAKLLAESTDGHQALSLVRLTAGRIEPLPALGAWSIACVVEGRVRYVTWEGRSSGSATPPERRILRETEVGPGDFVYFHTPPREPRGQQAVGRDAWLVCITARSAAAATRDRSGMHRLIHAA